MEAVARDSSPFSCGGGTAGPTPMSRERACASFNWPPLFCSNPPTDMSAARPPHERPACVHQNHLITLVHKQPSPGAPVPVRSTEAYCRTAAC